MLEFHADRLKYFHMQEWNAEKYVIPFIQKEFEIQKGMRVLEIGAGEGGVLKSFVDKGCTGVAVELDELRVINAHKFLKEDIASGKIKFITKDIYKVSLEELGGLFDLIILKDVIEHIHHQENLLNWAHSVIKPSGRIFFGYPPWQMPYGGHQQMGVKKLSRLPWIHLFSTGIYRGLLKTFGEPENNIDMLMEVKETGLSIEHFERILKETGWGATIKTHYIFNPIYEWKFKLKPLKQAGFITRIPYLRNFFTTCVYYLVRPVNH